MVSKKSRRIKRNKSTRKYKQRGGTNDELMQAVRAEVVDLEQIETILTNANITSDDLYDALMIAIMNNNVEVVKILLQQEDIDLNKQNEDGYIPLPFAMSEGRVEIVILLLQKGANADSFNFDDFDFSDINLYYTKISDGSFVNAKFVNANLTHTEFINCDFTNADMTDAIITDAVLTNCDFINATLTDTNFTGATVTNADFTDANINDAIGIIIPHTTDIGPPRPSQVITQDLSEFPTYSANNNSDLSQISNIDDNSFDADSSYDSGEWFTNENPPFRPLPLPVPPPRISRRDKLLSRNKVTLEKSKINPFLNSDLKGFDSINQEDADFCSYIEEDPDNVLFLYGLQSVFIQKSQLKTVMEDNDKIMYTCKELDLHAYRPRDENIIGTPYLNMNITGLSGIMIPLEQLDEVIAGQYQIFVVEPIVGNKPAIPIASLNARLGGNVVGAKFCQEDVPIKIGNISYVPKDVLQKQCANKELLRKGPKIGGTRRKNTKKRKQNKSKRRVVHKTKR